MTITHRLPNGIRILLDPMRDVQSVTMGVWVGVGARCESKEQNGLAHFLEHMAFKGTTSRDALAIAREIEDVGGIINAWTSRECTAYYARVLSDHSERALHLLADILSHSTFDSIEMERERGVILQEIGMAADTPEDVVWDHFQATAFPDQAIGRPILGDKDIIRTLPREDMQSFINHHYKADSMVIAVAGKMDEDKLLNHAQSLFANWNNDAPPPITSAHYEGGDHHATKKLEQSHIVQGVRAPSYHHDLHLACKATALIYGGGMASRLFQEIREKRGLAYHVSAFYQPYNDSGLFGFYAGTSHERVSEVRDVARELFHAIGDDVSDDELQRAQESLRASLLMGQESTAARCDRLAQQWLIYDKVETLEQSIARIDALTKDSIRNCITHLNQANETSAHLGLH